MINNYINHIVFVVDRSGSMAGLESQVVKVFDAQVRHLAKRSQELDQETRVSTYLFNDKIDNLFYDKDVLRLPSLQQFYKPTGDTALIDATLKAIDDLEKTAQLYGDHSFLVYVVTDGQNRVNNHKFSILADRIKKLPENWTLAAFVPDQIGVHEAKYFGFPANNIAVWNTDSKTGVEEVGSTMTKATDSYMYARSTGVRGTRSLFTLDASSLNTAQVKNNLVELKPTQYELLPVRTDRTPIKDFCESWLGEYRVGSAYYELSKKETIQSSKQLAVQHKLNGKVYTGLNARNLLNLPDYEVKVQPENYGDYKIFVQSSSHNRLLCKGTMLLVLK